MSAISSEKTTKSPQEKDKLFLSLVDMFVDAVDPDIIQMILQNRNWDLNSAVEDIMILANNFPNKKNDNLMKSNAVKDYRNPSKVTSPCNEKKVPNMRNPMVSKDQVNKKFASKPKLQEANKSRPTHSKPSEITNPNCQTFLEQYNYIKSNSSAYERTLMLIREGVKLMVILRGPPGIGKSFLAKQILNETCLDMPNYKRHIFSSDDFFITNNIYFFVPELLSEAHNWNQRNVSKAIKDQVSPIIVDNTNTQAWEMRVYADMAVSAGYDLEIVEPDRIGTIKESELAKRNVHNVPKAKIRNMIDRYERNITPHLLLTHFQLRYSLANMPPQPTRASKWKDKLSNHKNNKPKKKMFDGLKKPTIVGNTYSNNVENTKEGLQFQSHDLRPNSNPFFDSFQKESFPDDEYLHFNGISKQNHNSPSHSGKKYQTKVHNHQVEQHPEAFPSDFSTAKMSNDKDLNEYTELDGFLTNPIQKNDFKVNLRNGDLQGFTSVWETPSSESKSENELNPNHFDWMAETHKLLSAIGGSVSASKEARRETSGNHFSEENSNPFGNKESFFLDKSNVMPVEKSNEVEREHDRCEIPTVENEELVTDVSENGKPKWFHGVVEYVEDDTSWDYVLINDENTYVYQRTLFDPLPEKLLLNSQLFSATKSVNGFKGNDLTEIVIPLEPGEKLNFNPENETQSKANESSNGVESRTFNGVETFPSLGILIDTGASTLEPKEKESDTFENNYQDIVVRDHEVVSEDTNTVKSTDTQITQIHKVVNDIWSILENNNEKPTVLNSSPNSFDKDSHEIPASKIWNANHESDSIKENRELESSNPKPPRNLLRQKSDAKNKPQDLETKEPPDCFSTWDTVSNPLEQWTNKEETVVKEQRPLENAEILPQRAKHSKTLHDSSTNTNYVDFSLSSHLNPTGVKVLVGNPRSITDFVSSFKTDMPETLFLDKSTMTGEETSDHDENIDTTQISLLFPHLPNKCILEMVEKCQGNVDWAVDLLLDSEHSFYPEDCEESDESSDEGEDVSKATEEPTESIEPTAFIEKPAKCNSEEHDELKKIIEASVVFDKSHYSDQVLKVIKRKRPDYSSMIDQLDGGKSPSELPVQENRHDQNVLDSEEEVDDLSTSSSECDTDNEKEFMELIVNNDLLLQLRQKFGNSSLPHKINVTPVVKIPVSLARQLHGYVMDSIQSDMDQQQDIIEDTIMRDEEIAKLLQYDEEQCLTPQLQEIMDMEIALAMHKADQQELHEKNENTVAARLSQNILFEKFPQVDCKVLVEMLKAHNYSLHDTIGSLTLALDQPAQPGSSSQPLPQAPVALSVSEEASQRSDSDDLLEEAQSHRDQAATYYSLRSECLSKAHEAFRSGNKAVATYYSQMAQVHKKKVEVCNSRAAACLLSTHKKGNTLDLHFLHVMEAEVVLDMFLDEVISDMAQQARNHRTVFIITGRGLRSRGGISRIKPMVLRKLQARRLQYNEVNPGMLSVLIQGNSTLSHNN